MRLGAPLQSITLIPPRRLLLELASALHGAEIERLAAEAAAFAHPRGAEAHSADGVGELEPLGQAGDAHVRPIQSGDHGSPDEVGEHLVAQHLDPPAQLERSFEGPLGRLLTGLHVLEHQLLDGLVELQRLQAEAAERTAATQRPWWKRLLFKEVGR